MVSVIRHIQLSNMGPVPKWSDKWHSTVHSGDGGWGPWPWSVQCTLQHWSIPVLLLYSVLHYTVQRLSRCTCNSLWKASNCTWWLLVCPRTRALFYDSWLADCIQVSPHEWVGGVVFGQEWPSMFHSARHSSALEMEALRKIRMTPTIIEIRKNASRFLHDAEL